MGSKYDPVAALEIGTTRTVIAVGEPLDGGRVRVTALGKIPSCGVRKSQITDIGQASASVKSVIRQVADYDVRDVVLVVSGPHLSSRPFLSHLAVEGKTVTEADVEKLLDHAFAQGPSSPDREVLDVTEIDYGVDGLGGVATPVGMSARHLELTSLAVEGAAARVNDAREAVRQAQVSVGEVTCAALAAAAGALTEARKREGALLIDLGGGSTSYAAFSNGRAVFVGTLGVGGNHVTEDVRSAFGLQSRQQAETAKVAHASALVRAGDGGERVEIASNSTATSAVSVSRRALNVVVNARMREIFEIVLADLDRVGVAHLVRSGVVLTGGGAAMRDVAELASGVFGRPAEVGDLVPEIEGLDGQANRAAYATVAGALLRECETAEPVRESFFGKLLGGGRK